MGVRGEVFSSRASSGTRTYFFNVKENRAGDLFLNIVESKKHGEEGFERHQVVVFQEDFSEFLKEFQKAADFMKQNSRRGGGRFRRDGFRSEQRDRPKTTVRVKRRREPSGDGPNAAGGTSTSDQDTGTNPEE